MRYNKTLISTIIISNVFSSVAFAGDCGTAASDPPTVTDILCAGSGLLNVFFSVVGVVFILGLLYGAYKAAMAIGDPKALLGAQQTWTWLLVGLGVVVIAFSIVGFIWSFAGFGGAPTTALWEYLSKSVDSFLTSIGTTR